MWLIAAYQLHRFNFGCSRQCAGGECVDKGFDRVGIIVKYATHSRHQVDNVGIVLQVFVEIHFHVVAVARQVVASEVNQHHMLGVFLRVIAQIFRTATVRFDVAGATCCARNGVDISFPVLNAATL